MSVMKCMCECNKEWIHTDRIKIIDVREGPQGEDIVKFTCPTCQKEHESIVVKTAW